MQAQKQAFEKDALKTTLAHSNRVKKYYDQLEVAEKGKKHEYFL